MKIMMVDNNPKVEYNRENESGWNMTPSLYVKKGETVLGVGKKDLLKFYLLYKRFKPDIILFVWLPAGFMVPFFKKLGLIKCPIIHLYNERNYTEQMKRYHPKFILRFMENYSLKNVDYFMTVSKTNEKMLKKMGKNVVFIPHGYFRTKNKKTKINLDKLKTEKNNLKVVYLGEQSKFKKVDILVKSVKGLGCDLFMVGGVNEEFRKFASKNVHFLGYINPLEVNSLLKQADILVNPSDMDTNFKFIEYIRAVKPILAYDGLPRNMFKHKENAFLTKNFRNGLMELIRDKKLRERLKKNVKKIEVFTWDKIADKHLELYKKIISWEKINCNEICGF